MPHSTSDEARTFDAQVSHRSSGGAHQNAVEVISGHIGGRSWQQGPRLSFVVRDESLDLIIHQFVGEIHAVNALHLGHKAIYCYVIGGAVQWFWGVFGGREGLNMTKIWNQELKIRSRSTPYRSQPASCRQVPCWSADSPGKAWNRPQESLRYKGCKCCSDSTPGRQQKPASRLCWWYACPVYVRGRKRWREKVDNNGANLKVKLLRLILMMLLDKMIWFHCLFLLF